MRLQLPLVRLLEGGGGSVAPRSRRAARRRSWSTRRTRRRASCRSRRSMAQAPVVSAALGAVAGLPAARLVASHFSLMARDTAQVLIAGPALVERARGVHATKEELGGARVHLRSGVVDNAADDERRRVRAGAPLPVLSADERVAVRAGRATATIRPTAPRRSCSRLVPRERRKTLQDAPRARARARRGELLRARARVRPLARSRGLARLRGQPVGVLANDPNFYAGAMTAQARAEAAPLRRAVRHLPPADRLASSTSPAS